MSTVRIINMRQIIILAILMNSIVFLSSEVITREYDVMSQWASFSKNSSSKQLMEWIRCVAQEEISGNTCSYKPDIIIPPYFGSAGIFVTIQNKNKVIGCCGSFYHGIDDFRIQVRQYIKCAMSEDERNEPVTLTQLQSSTIILTISTMPYQIKTIDTIDLTNYGLYIECKDQYKVFVPSEIRNRKQISIMLRDKTCTINAFKAITMKSLP